jgi:hypothetical protein
MAVVAAVGAVLGFWLAAANDADSVWPATIVFGVGGFLAGVIVVAGWAESRPYTLYRQVPIAADAIHGHAEQWFGRAPWVLARNDPHELVYWRRTEPAKGTVLFLLILGVVPGVLYYFWARGPQTIAIGLTPAPVGSDLEIVVHPQRSDGRNRAIDLFNSLHGLVGTGPSPRP